MTRSYYLGRDVRAAAVVGLCPHCPVPANGVLSVALLRQHCWPACRPPESVRERAINQQGAIICAQAWWPIRHSDERTLERQESVYPRCVSTRSAVRREPRVGRGARVARGRRVVRRAAQDNNVFEYLLLVGYMYYVVGCTPRVLHGPE
eukprot:COSAG02_NODE_1454_length_12536_cov_347.064163_9_plen_149_part_00